MQYLDELIQILFCQQNNVLFIIYNNEALVIKIIKSPLNSSQPDVLMPTPFVKDISEDMKIHISSCLVFWPIKIMAIGKKLLV